MAATIKDIRRETGLALATISKYLNGGNVKKENREKIEEAIKKLDYHPNEMARSLVTKKTRTIAFVINDIASQFSGILLRHAGELLRKEGYSMMICDSGHDKSREAENIRFCIEKQVDGILLLPVSMDNGFLEPAVRANVPVVLLDREMKEQRFDSVTIDNQNAAERAVNRLIHCGHRRIAVIHSLEYTGAERFLGYKRALEKAGIPFVREYEITGKLHSTGLGYEGMRYLTSLPERPTAVFMTNYEIGLGVVMALNEDGLRCPEDVSLIGFDELILTLVMRPRMAVVIQPMEEICQEAVRLVLKRIREGNDAVPQRLTLYAPLEEGESIAWYREEIGN